jgi:hypothetical protein
MTLVLLRQQAVLSELLESISKQVTRAGIMQLAQARIMAVRMVLLYYMAPITQYHHLSRCWYSHIGSTYGDSSRYGCYSGCTAIGSIGTRGNYHRAHRTRR